MVSWPVQAAPPPTLEGRPAAASQWRCPRRWWRPDARPRTGRFPRPSRGPRSPTSSSPHPLCPASATDPGQPWWTSSTRCRDRRGTSCRQGRALCPQLSTARGHSGASRATRCPSRGARRPSQRRSTAGPIVHGCSRPSRTTSARTMTPWSCRPRRRRQDRRGLPRPSAWSLPWTSPTRAAPAGPPASPELRHRPLRPSPPRGLCTRRPPCRTTRRRAWAPPPRTRPSCRTRPRTRRGRRRRPPSSRAPPSRPCSGARAARGGARGSGASATRAPGRTSPQTPMQQGWSAPRAARTCKQPARGGRRRRRIHRSRGSPCTAR
mmetsp:Transcript_35196/g.98875  ORF Transcript_35196/g.98875 Transcript_35196/m.98875 type:complete len:321 (+) Transcript_35196:67-1029(+)